MDKKEHPARVEARRGAGSVVVDFQRFRARNYSIRRKIRPTSTEGWLRRCVHCGISFILHWVAGGVRDGRERYCHECLARGRWCQ